MRPEARALQSALEKSDRLANTLSWLADEVEPYSGIDGTQLAELDRREQLSVLAFLKGFEQLQDSLSRNVIRRFLLAQGDDVRGYSARDGFNRAASLGALDDEDRFFGIHMLRNRLAHDYPADPEERAKNIRDAIAAAPVLLSEYETLAARARDLLGDQT